MTYTEQAIKIAIENGYEPFHSVKMDDPRITIHYLEGNEYLAEMDGWPALPARKRVEQILLDPLFWQALGCGLGWGDENGIDHRTFWNGTIEYPEISDEGVGYREIWRYQMHRLTDYVAEGKTIESFFEQLVK